MWRATQSTSTASTSLLRWQSAVLQVLWNTCMSALLVHRRSRHFCWLCSTGTSPWCVTPAPAKFDWCRGGPGQGEGGRNGVGGMGGRPGRGGGGVNGRVQTTLGTRICACYIAGIDLSCPKGANLPLACGGSSAIPTCIGYSQPARAIPGQVRIALWVKAHSPYFSLHLICALGIGILDQGFFSILLCGYLIYARGISESTLGPGLLLHQTYSPVSQAIGYSLQCFENYSPVLCKCTEGPIVLKVPLELNPRQVQKKTAASQYNPIHVYLAVSQSHWVQWECSQNAQVCSSRNQKNTQSIRTIWVPSW